MKTKLGIVGCGFLGNIVADAWKKGLLPDYELVGVTSRTRASAEKTAANVGCAVCEDVDALLALEPEYIVEAASVESVRAMAIPVLKRGVNLVILSIGAFADLDFYAQVQQAARRTGLDQVMPQLIRSLSKGYRQRVGIAQALLGSPQLIILDEPTVGLDPAQVIEIRNLIRELGKAHTVILSSHILSEVQAVCSQVLILSKGHLVAVGAPEQLAEKLNPGSRLRATALGGGKTVLKTVGSIPGIRKVEIESEADGQVTFTAESADASDRRAEVSRALSQAGCTVLALAAENRTLEEVFLALTENESETPSDEGEEKTE